MIVMSEAAFAAACAERRYHYYSTENLGYDGGYYDGKLMDLSFLRDVAAKGSEPARSAFEGAIVAMCREPEVERILPQIPVYPEDDRQRRIESFACQLCALPWFAGEAEKRGDAYLLQWAATRGYLFACRTVLAYNRVLYPFHKWVRVYVDRCPEKPAGLGDALDAAIGSPSRASIDALSALILGWLPEGLRDQAWVPRFFEDVEWTWRDGRPGIEDW